MIGVAPHDDAVDGVNELGVSVFFGSGAVFSEPVDLVVCAGDEAVEACGYEGVSGGHSSSPQRMPVLVSTRRGTSRDIAAGIMSWAREVISSSSPGATSKMSSSWTWAVMRDSRTAAVEFVGDVDHCDLDDVGGCPLDGHVHGHAFRSGSITLVRRAQVREVSTPPIQSFGVASHLGNLLLMLNEVADAGVSPEVEVDEFTALLLREVGLACDAMGSETIDDAEVEDFGDASLVAGDVLDAVHGACGCVVDVFAVVEGFEEAGFAGHMGEDAKLDLRVVSG